jgi:hypothetical protein
MSGFGKILDIWLLRFKERIIGQWRKMPPMAVLWDSPASKAKKKASILKQLSIYYRATTQVRLLTEITL